MSDMSRPSKLPTSADHADHDVLLVSQLAAADPLEPAERRRASALVAECAECAALVDDLGILATAVAWEPIPPRRRDFRLSVEAAEAARGSRLDRLLRRLTLPSASGLRPVAAGVMSLGLVLVIAGSFWPEDVFDDGVPQEAPIQVFQAAPTTLLDDASDTQNLTLELESVVASAPPVVGSLSAPAQLEANASQDDAAVAERATAGPDAIDDVFAQDARLADEVASEPAAGRERRADQDPAAKAAGSPLGYDVAPGQGDSDVLGAAEMGPSASTSAAADRAVDAEEGSSRLELPSETQGQDAPGASDVAATSVGDGASIEAIVTLAGLGLLLAGLLLWLVVWVARRRDAGSYAR